ncbi:MAG: HAD family phosphatase [Clostridiaceae bacterium]|nr:HAD family phosphatase [Clostridiaceae bacterium]MDY4546878.1 HAD family phosphatase [Candidatus Choladocola sp.]RGD94570.1 HAD family phosphatase [Clostridiales bacterium AM23-16LB]RHR46238.1 HAD family phosphatase [Clostridiaceae bacterium AF18-31LB]RHT81308.1 HAD family phosphatase [Clostridiaceae bacterium AM27-36LB]
MQYQAVVFDMDGVIFDTERLVIEFWKEVAKKHNIPNVEHTCIQCLGTNRVRTREIFLENYGADFPFDPYRAEVTELFNTHYKGVPLPTKPGVRELLSYLQEQDIKVGLASSTAQHLVRDEIGTAGLLPYFQTLVCGDMVEHSKPAPDIFLKACEILNADPTKSIAIEDSFNGIRSAHCAGMTPIMVPDQVQPTDEIRTLAFHVMPSLLDVLNWLKTLA